MIAFLQAAADTPTGDKVAAILAAAAVAAYYLAILGVVVRTQRKDG